MLALVFLTAAYVGPSSTSVQHSAARCNSPNALLGRRAFAGAAALFLGATAAEAKPGDIRKADQSQIGVSRVTIAPMAQGSPGAGVIPVKVDTDGWKGTGGNQDAVIGPSGAAGGSPNGFLCLGDKDCYKKAEKATAARAAAAAADK